MLQAIWPHMLFSHLYTAATWCLMRHLRIRQPHADQSTPQRPHGGPPRNLHLEEQMGLVSRNHADPAAPSRKRPAEPSLKDWQTQARSLLGRPQKASTYSILCAARRAQACQRA